MLAIEHLSFNVTGWQKVGELKPHSGTVLEGKSEAAAPPAQVKGGDGSKYVLFFKYFFKKIR